MKIKAILFDVDGIVIKRKEKLFSQRFAEEFNIPLEKVNEFFEKDFRECSFGRADLKEKIKPFLEKWNWSGDTNSFLKYWFESDNTLDQEVLNKIEKLKEKGIKCYLVTRQEKYRMNYLWDTLNLKNSFDGYFCTANIGYNKSQPEFFEHILKNLKIKPKEIMFFDDQEKNIQNAKNLGIEAYFYKGMNDLKKI